MPYLVVSSVGLQPRPSGVLIQSDLLEPGQDGGVGGSRVENAQCRSTSVKNKVMRVWQCRSMSNEAMSRDGMFVVRY